MKTKVRVSSVAACLLTASLTAASGVPQVTYAGGLLTIECSEAPLAHVFERIRAATGMELILEDSVKTKRLSAQIEAQPIHRAIERLLEGSGVNYALSFDQKDWRLVTKVFVGSGGGGPASPARQGASRTPIRRRPARRASPAADPDREEEMLNDLEEDAPPEEETENPADEGAPGEAEESVPSFLPPAPSYPRSSFTPGLESSPFRQRPAGESSEDASQQEGKPAPPAYYPFLDPFGRPIPVPKDQRQQQQKKKPKENQ